MRKLISAVAFAAALAVGSSASAATINISATVDNSGQESLWTDMLTFVLPSGYSNAVLTITSFVADDRAIAELNGTAVDSTGIFGPGSGSFNFGSGNDPWTYTIGNGARNVVVNSGFLTGTNTILITVNDTFNGIFGDLFNGADGPAGPTSYAFQATVTYDTGSVVPEPATWALMIGGLGLTGAAIRRRRFALS